MSKLNSVKLNWDSDFFNINVSKIDICNSINALSELETEINILKKDSKLIYIFSNPTQIEENSLIESLGGKLYDQKVIFTQELKDTYNSVSNIRSLSNKELTSKIIDLSIQSGEYSRFKLDINIPEQKFNDLYTIWITKSINKEIAIETFGYFDEGNLVGIITLGIKNLRADIGLLAVDKLTRGKAIGNKLLEHTFNYFKNNNLSSVQVVTQLHNEIACNFYKKNKFNQESVTNIYHLWV